ncbi:MAG: glycosyltransferase family 4 protein [Thermodesulfobacteriota bacterium]
MKVLLVNKFFYLKGGAERVYFQEREGLLAGGHQVVEFAMRHSANIYTESESFFASYVDYFEPMSFGKKLITAIRFIHSSEAVRKIRDLVKEQKPDIVHLHNIYHQLTPSIIPALKQLGVPVVLTVHDGKLICPSYLMLRHGHQCLLCRERGIRNVIVKRCQDSMSRNLLLFAEALWHRWKRSYEQVDLFISPSEFHKKLISARVDESKIRVLPNGIEILQFEPRFDHDGYVLFFGRISPEKGIKTLLEAFSFLQSKPQLKIVGSGPLENELQRTYGKTAEFLSYMSGEKLKNIIRGAACVVVPSECIENCSMTVLESMALGKPVIGSRVGGIPEQIIDGKTGLLFEPGNSTELAKKINDLLADNHSLISMGKSARQRVEEKYTILQHMDGLLNIYSSLGANPGC